MNTVVKISEPHHDKTKKLMVRPAKTQISLGIQAYFMRTAKILIDAQADLSLRWVQSNFAGFVVLRLNSVVTVLLHVSFVLKFSKTKTKQCDLLMSVILAK